MAAELRRFIAVLAASLSVAGLRAQETAADPWDGLPREKAASLQIEWRGGGATKSKTGPADIQAETPVTLIVAGTRTGDEVRWWQIIPDTRQFYKNANHPWEPEPYKWVGFAKVPCVRRELGAFRGRAQGEIWPGKNAEPSTPHPLAFADGGFFYHTDCGSFWFQVEVKRDGRILRSPGIEESGEKGMSPRVFRLSVRKADGFLGILTSYCNVPGLFGCVPWQSYHYVGVDCADVLMAAACRCKGVELKRDWNVAMIVDQWPKAAELELAAGKFSRELKWGRDVKPGCLVAVRYAGGNTYQHIGALMGDTNGNGILDAADTIIHAGPEALRVSDFASGSFDGHIVVIRNE